MRRKCNAKPESSALTPGLSRQREEPVQLDVACALAQYTLARGVCASRGPEEGEESQCPMRELKNYEKRAIVQGLLLTRLCSLPKRSQLLPDR